MPNNFFRFKQFIIHQEHSAMKVCTDACLFGAWVVSLIRSKKIESNFMLDIGTGTGLLSLMLAQQLPGSTIHAVEIDAAAAKEASENVLASPWHNRIAIFNTAIQSFTAVQQYDFIITNPPFFQNDLQSPDTKRNLALHSHQLGLEELLTAIQELLSGSGHFAILLPYHRTQFFETLAQHAGFYVHQKTSVQQTPAHFFFRSMLLFGRAQQPPEETTVVIKQKTGNYTEEFVALLKDYYLYL